MKSFEIEDMYWKQPYSGAAFLMFNTRHEEIDSQIWAASIRRHRSRWHITNLFGATPSSHKGYKTLREAKVVAEGLVEDVCADIQEMIHYSQTERLPL
jgi:hypothetical protein